MTPKIFFRVALVSAVLPFGFHASALAQTPDGLTPAVEEVCSDLNGAAFGLCNAYCEAMDCATQRQMAEAGCLLAHDPAMCSGDAQCEADFSFYRQQCLLDAEAAWESCVQQCAGG